MQPPLSSLWVVAALLTTTQTALALPPSARLPKLPKIESYNVVCDGSQAGAGVGHFDQLLDHGDPALGTFPQRYFWSSEYWGGPGYPVVLMTPGEDELGPYCGYLSYRSLAAQIAAAVKGAIILIERESPLFRLPSLRLSPSCQYPSLTYV